MLKEPTKGVKSWFAKAKDLGITVLCQIIIKSRVSSFSSNLGVIIYSKARKPMGKAFKMAIKNENSTERNRCCRRSNAY